MKTDGSHGEDVILPWHVSSHSGRGTPMGYINIHDKHILF